MLDNVISAVIDFSSNQGEFHPLHVVVSDNEFFKCVCPHSLSHTQDSKFSLMNSFCGAIFIDDVFPRNIFVTVHVQNIDTNATERDFEILHLYVTAKFLEHYNFSHGTVVSFKPIHSFSVSRVVIHAKTIESYIWAKSKGWQMQLLLSTCRNKILCRRNDVLLASPKIFGLEHSKLLFDLTVAVCEPIEQGSLTMNTSIFVVNISDSLASHWSQATLFQNKRLCSFSLPKQPEKIAQSLLMSMEVKYLKLQVIQWQALVVNKVLGEGHDLIDSLNVIIVSFETFKELNMQAGELAIITLHNVPQTTSSVFGTGAETKHKKKSRLAAFMPYLIDSEASCNAYVSPYLWFNLSSQPISPVQSEALYIEVSTCEKVSSLPPYAEEVYVSLVQSPYYDGTIVCDNILESYFSKRRYILKGDIFAIDAKDAVDFRQKSNDLDNIRCPMVYFRISVIEGPVTNYGYFADVDHSKFYQAGTIQSYIPVLIENVPSFFCNSTYFDYPNPSGMDIYVNQLVSLILPVLKIWNKGSFQDFRVSMNILLTGRHGCGKTVTVKSVCRCLNLHLYVVNCHELIGESSATTEARLESTVQKASVYAPCIMLLKNIDFIGKEKELKGENSRVLNSLSEELKKINLWRCEWPIIVIATTDNMNLLSGDLISSFLHHIHISAPLEQERKYMLQHFMYPYTLHPNVSINYMSQRTAGFILGDLSALAMEAIRFRYSRLRQILFLQKDIFFEEDLAVSGIHVTQQDLISALEKEQAFKAEKSGAPKIPSVLWEDVGGLADAKQEILDTIQLPLKHPEILLTGLRRSGILLYGPPGTGKTLLAKAVATECSLNFLNVKGPELINMYIGQSEENVRAIFQQARSATPCIIFFDELDSLAPSRGKSGDSGGVTDRVVSQFLAELDGINNFAEVFVIGATNRPDLIDSALLRPGRFDRHVYVGISSDNESRLSIMSALTRKLPISADVDLEEIINKCPQYLTGADFYSLCSNAMMHSVKRNVKLIQEGAVELKNAEKLVKTEDFMLALETLVPSLSENELKQYHSIRL